MLEVDTMPAQTLKKYLDSNHVKYTIITHSPEYTAQEIAASAHIPGKDLAKTVIVKIDGDFAMAVLPASMHVSLKSLKEAAGAGDAEIASESEFEKLFPDCELGAMLPSVISMICRSLPPKSSLRMTKSHSMPGRTQSSCSSPTATLTDSFIQRLSH